MFFEANFTLSLHAPPDIIKSSSKPQKMQFRQTVLLRHDTILVFFRTSQTGGEKIPTTNFTTTTANCTCSVYQLHFHKNYVSHPFKNHLSENESK